MARTKLIIPFEEFTVAQAAWKTAASFKAGANQLVAILSIKFAGLGVSGDAKPIRFRFGRITPDDGTGTAVTPVHTNTSYTFTPRTTARNLFTAEPALTAATDIYYPDKWHPQGGLVGNFEFHDFTLKNGEEMAVQMFAESGETQIDLSGHVLIEE